MRERQVQTTVTIPEAWEPRIKALADRIGIPIPVSQAAVIRLALGRGLEILEREQGSEEPPPDAKLDHLEDQIEIVDDHVRKIEGEIDTHTQQLIRIEKLLEVLSRRS